MFLGRNADLCLPRSFQILPARKSAARGIVLIDIQSEPVRRKTARLVQKEACRAAAFRLWRDGELIEIGCGRIECHESKQPVQAVKSAERDGSGRFEFPQMIEKPRSPRQKIDCRHRLLPACDPKFREVREIASVRARRRTPAMGEGVLAI